MDGRKHPVQTQFTFQRATSASALKAESNVTVEKQRQSEGATPPVDALPPKHPQSGSGGNAMAAGKTTGGLRLGGLSRYLLEKAQSNDSGLDLSPATLQTLVHPLRTSTSSSSSSNLYVRNLFESPASSSEESPPVHGYVHSSIDVNNRNNNAPETPAADSKSVSHEQSHNLSETTVIEKTLTDEQSSRNISNVNTSTVSQKDNVLKPIVKNDGAPERKPESGTKDTSEAKLQRQVHYNLSSTFMHPDNITPKERGFQVPYEYPSQVKTNAGSVCNENEYGDGGGRTSAYQQHHHQNNRSFPSSDVAAVIPSTRSASQTPKPKSCKKKAPVPTSTKKPTGARWKFLSEHVNDKEFLILDQLGKGGCGQVSLVMEKDTRKQYALKIVQLHGIDEALVQECINEVEMLIDLKGTDLVVEIHSWEFNRAERTMKILMERGQCDLNQTILRANKMRKPIKLLKMKFIWESLLTIVQEIHNKGIVHADLKPANFVWVDDNLKIIDFGIASRLQTDLTSISMPNPKGTLNFVSPEILQADDSGRSKLSPKSDIWALGCILYVMVFGRSPFEHITHPAMKMNAIVNGDIMYPTLPPYLAESQVIDVLKLCFQTDYRRRPTAAELLRHPFLT